MNNVTLIVDGSYLLHRVLHIPAFTRMYWNGEFTGGVFGFIKNLKSTLDFLRGGDYKVNSTVVVFDGSLSKRRKSLYSEYKGNRVPATEESKNYIAAYKQQRDLLANMLGKLGVVVAFPDYEGDDTIAELTRLLPNQKIIASDDFDIMGLVGETTHVYRPMKGDLITLENFEAVAQIPKAGFVLYKALLGDTSDNIEGVSKVGVKTAQKIVNDIRSSELHMLLSYCKAPTTISKRIMEGFSVIERNIKLVDLSISEFTEADRATLAQALEQPVELNQTKQMEIFQVFTKLGFSSFTQRFQDFILPFLRLKAPVNKTLAMQP